MEVPWEVPSTISHPFECSTKESLSKLKVSIVGLNGTSPSPYLSLVLQIDFHFEFLWDHHFYFQWKKIWGYMGLHFPQNLTMEWGKRKKRLPYLKKLNKTTIFIFGEAFQIAWWFNHVSSAKAITSYFEPEKGNKKQEALCPLGSTHLPGQHPSAGFSWPRDCFIFLFSL